MASAGGSKGESKSEVASLEWTLKTEQHRGEVKLSNANCLKGQKELHEE